MNHQIALAVSKIILIWKWIWRHFWFDPSIDYNRTGIEIYYFDSGGSNSLKLEKKDFFSHVLQVAEQNFDKWILVQKNIIFYFVLWILLGF